MNDLLDDLIRAADPGTVRRNDPLSERGLRELAQYEAMEAALVQEERVIIRMPLVRARKRLELVGMGVSLFIIMVVVFSFVSFLHPTAATAATPPLLEITPVNAQASELLTKMADTRRVGPDRGTTIRSQTWVLSTSVGNDGEIESSIIEPQWSRATFEPNGSIRYVVTAADAFLGQNNDGLPKPGTVLEDKTFSAAEWNSFRLEIPTDSMEIGSYLSQFIGTDDLTAGQILRELTTILLIYPIKADQEAALIDYLSTLDDITVIGSTKDRLGREGIVFSASDRLPGRFEDRLVISSTTGRVLASETIYSGTDIPDIETPAVIEYTAWQ